VVVVIGQYYDDYLEAGDERKGKVMVRLMTRIVLKSMETMVDPELAWVVKMG
jgi:hypothetical protein